MAWEVAGPNLRVCVDCRAVFSSRYTLMIRVIFGGMHLPVLARLLTSVASCNCPWLKKHVRLGREPPLLRHSSILLYKTPEYVFLLYLVQLVICSLQVKWLLIQGQVVVCVTSPEIPFPPHYSSCTKTLFVQLIAICLKIHHRAGAKSSLN